jgi:uncharacterized protein (DUF1786 family)
MQILAVDIGTGTQDIFLYNSSLDIENGYKLVMPSPTLSIYRKLQLATRQKQSVALTGVTMGGGPSSWAVEAHARSGLPVFATPDAACTIDDDLDKVQAMGVQVIGEEEADRLPEDVLRVELRDFDFTQIAMAFSIYGVSLNEVELVTVGVFDHGAAPSGVSDCRFRFDYLDRRIRAENRLSAFAYPADQIPAEMTRLRAVAQSASMVDAPLVVMDTAPAAVLGALYDYHLAHRERKLVANVGNYHTLAFMLGPDGIEGVFEHHTGEMKPEKLDDYLQRMALGTLEPDEVFNDKGHGAITYTQNPLDLQSGPFGVVVVGPRRKMMYASQLRPYFAAPFGDMMITGCFGLLSAAADCLPDVAGPVHASLNGEAGIGTPPWEVN